MLVRYKLSAQAKHGNEANSVRLGKDGSEPSLAVQNR